ncbi:MAG: DUF1080 domain-containing protein [Bacteroidales bacterium]|nr:MAG: DUF1080 domain-containing protein [Bacteroidales bacterium]
MKPKGQLARPAITVLIFFVFTITGFSQAQDNPFLGRWALFLPGGPGWLDIRQEKGYLDGDILWYAGSVVPVSSVLMKNDTLVITRSQDLVRKRDADGNPVRTQTYTTWIECILVNGGMVGKVMSPGRRGGINTTGFTGKKIPDLPEPPNLRKIKYGEPVQLFNGKDLTGWTLINPNQTNGFKVMDGVMVNDPVQPEGGPRVSYGNLRTIDEFEDFNLTIEVNIPEGSNSGIYLRGIYEVQVLDSYKRPLDPHNMGAIYSRITPSVNAEKPAGEWQSLDITLCDRYVTILLNGKKIIDNKPLYGVTGGALTSDEFIPGPIYLQGDHGKVSYRNIVLRPIMK